VAETIAFDSHIELEGFSLASLMAQALRVLVTAQRLVG
jgi:hypothetical protein